MKLKQLTFACLGIVGSAPLALADKKISINVAIQQNGGEKVRGPATISVSGLNPIRQNIAIGSTVTYPSGPSLAGLPFIPPIPSAQAQQQGAGQPSNLTSGQQAAVARALRQGGSTGVSASAGDLFAQYLNGPNGLNELETVRVDLVSQINQLIDDFNRAAMGVQSLATATDVVLRSGGVTGPSDSAITTGILTPLGAVNTQMSALAVRSWPYQDIATLTGSLNNLRNLLATLPAAATDWSSWITGADHKASYDAAVTRTNDLITSVSDLSNPNNASLTSFQNLRTQLGTWSGVLTGVSGTGVSAFRYEQTVTCSFAFENSKETKLEIITTDRLSQAATPVRQELITVVCSSPFVVSGGFGFSTIDESSIVFQSSSKTDSSGKAQSVFGFEGHSNYRPIPLLLLNVRVWEPSDLFSFHISGGAAVDIKTGSTGTDVEYVLGPSIAIRRSLFLTPALHFGRVGILSPESGFKIGDVVPSGLNSPPIQKSWKKAFVFAFTWKIR